MSHKAYEAHHNMPSYKNFAVECAYDLKYPKVVIDKVISASTDEEVSRIMCDARNGKYGEVKI